MARFRNLEVGIRMEPLVREIQAQEFALRVVQ
jgi:hypothetical protein